MTKPSQPDDFAEFDSSHLTPPAAADFFSAFFTAKSGRDLDGLMASWCLGGGFEWQCAPGFATLDGVTAIELNAAGLITRAAVVYDSRHLETRDRDALVLLSTRG